MMQAGLSSPVALCVREPPRPLAHVVDADADVQRLLTRWLGAAGIESRSYSHLGAFLDARCTELPGCLVIGAQPRAISGVESHAILLPLSVNCLVGFVAEPLREQEIVSAVCAAIEVDRRQRLIASCHAELRARFATLTPREQQVMTMVTRGMLNKQVGLDLGVSVITVKAHRGAAMRKMRARSLADLVRMADAIGAEPVPARNVGLPPVRSAAVADLRIDYTLAHREQMAAASFRTGALRRVR